jgi:hypothetical protein
MNKFDLIMTQVEKTPFQARTDKWMTLPQLKSESDFTDADVVPDQPHTSNLRFSTITQQIQKKKPSQKSKRDRVSAKSVLLADKLGSDSYK